MPEQSPVEERCNLVALARRIASSAVVVYLRTTRQSAFIGRGFIELLKVERRLFFLLGTIARLFRWAVVRAKRDRSAAFEWRESADQTDFNSSKNHTGTYAEAWEWEAVVQHLSKAATVVHLAARLHKPILLEGPPGSGKTANTTTAAA